MTKNYKQDFDFPQNEEVYKYVGTIQHKHMAGRTAEGHLYCCKTYGGSTVHGYAVAVECQATTGESVTIAFGGPVFDCPRMGRCGCDAFGYMDSELAEYGELAYQMFDCTKTTRKPFPMGFLFSSWHVYIYGGKPEVLKNDPTLLELAIECGQKLIRQYYPIDKKFQKYPIYFAYFGLLELGRTTLHMRDKSRDVLRGKKYPSAYSKSGMDLAGNKRTEISDNDLFNIASDTKLALFQFAASATCGSIKNFLVVNSEDAISSFFAKCDQANMPIIAGIRRDEEDFYDEDDDYFEDDYDED